MSDTKIFSLGDQGGGNGMAGLIASLCQNRGLDPNMVMAMMNNRGGYGDGFGGGFGAWWIIILLIFGWGGFGNGFGGGFGGRGSAQGLADLGNLINNDSGRELIMSAIQGNGTAISQLASTLHCDVNALQSSLNSLSSQLCAIGNQVGMSGQQVINAIQAGDCNLASQLASCCCDVKTLVTNQGYENRITTIQQTDDIKSDATTKFNILSAKIDAQTQLLSDKFCELEKREMQNKIDALRQENSQLALAASQQAQSKTIIDAVRPCPSPAYIVPNPCGCGGYQYGGRCGNDGCGY